MRRFLVLATLASLAAAPGIAAPTQPALGPVAYLPMPPEFVCGGIVQKAEWSPDGRYVLATRSHLTFTTGLDTGVSATEVSVYNASTRKSTVVLTDRNPGTLITTLAWLPGTSVALLGVRLNTPGGEPSAAVWRVDARRATASVVAGVESDEELMVSPTRALAFVWRLTESGLRIRTLSATGTLGAPMLVARGTPTGWNATGLCVFVNSQTSEPPVTLSLDPLTGRTKPVERTDPYTPPPAPRLPFRLESTVGANRPAEGPFDRQAGTPLMILQDTKAVPSLMIAADADSSAVSPRMDGVLYTNIEGAFVVPLMRVSADELATGHQKAQQAHVLSNGKQIGLAVLLYAADHDDVLPSSADDIKALLQPYARNAAIFEGVNGDANAFHYVYSGGPLKDIANPSETVLATVDGPGGQAQVYADGHVTWKAE